MEDKESYSLKQKVGLLLGPAVLVAVLAVPAGASLSPEAKGLAGLVLLMATFWVTEAIPIPVTAMLPLLFFPLLKIMPSSKVAPNYTNHLVFLFVGGFFLATAIEKWNLHRRIALHIIKVSGTRPSRLIFGFILAAALLAMWVSNTATAMMLLPVGMAVVVQLAGGASYDGVSGPDAEQKIKVEFGMLVMLGIAYGASIGGIGTLIGTPPNIVMAGFIKKIYPQAPEIDFLRWSLAALPVVAVLLPLSWVILCRFTGGFDLRKVTFASDEGVIEGELKKIGRIGREEKKVAALFGVTVFLWVFRQPIAIGSFIIPGWSQLFGDSHGAYFHDATVAMLAGIALFLIPVDIKSGTFLLDWKTAVSRTPWGIVFLFGGGFALADGFNATGLDNWLGSQLSVFSHLPIIALLFIMLIFVIHLTEFTSNTASATMLLPILASTAVAMGENPLLLMIPATLACSMAFMLPVATPPNAIVFGGGWVSASRMARTGFILNMVASVVLTGLGYLWILFVFGVSPGEVPDWVPVQ